MANESSTTTPETQAWILWSALLAGQGMIWIVALVLAPISKVDANLFRILPIVAYIMSISTGAVAVLLSTSWNTPTGGADASKAAQIALARKLMGWAMVEGAVLFAAVAYLLTANSLVFPAAILSLAVFILCAPRQTTAAA